MVVIVVVIVVERRPRRLAPCGRRDARQRVALEVAAHVLACRLPHCQEHALSLVVARAVLVRLSEISEDNWPVDSGDDLREANLIGWAAEYVSTADAPLRAHQTRALQGEQDLFEIWLRQSRSLGDVAHRGRPRGIGVECQREQCSTRIITPGGHSHEPIVGARASRGCFAGRLLLN